MLTVDQFDRSLKRPLGEKVTAQIVARQRNLPKDGQPQSPLITEKFLSRVIVDSGRDPLCESQQLVYEKVVSKWIGRQGRAPDKQALQECVESYYVIPDVDCNSIFTSEARILFQQLLGEYRYQLQTYLNETASYRQVYNSLMRMHKSNSGYYRFTSGDEARTHEFIIDALRCSVDQHPSIVWYRDMRQKLRVIFGESLSNLARQKRYLNGFVLKSHFIIPYVTYNSEMITSRLIWDFCRRHSFRVVAGEGDFDGMDTTFSLNLAKWVYTTVCSVLDLPVQSEVVIELQKCFTAPLIDFDGYVRTGEHTLFSGQFPTNGLEGWANLIFICCVVAEVFKHLPPVDFLPLVMGDDSTVLFASANLEYAQLFTRYYATLAPAFGFKAKVEKQREASDATFFCKRLYPLKPIRGWKMHNNVPVPIYEIVSSVNSILNPEDGPSLTQTEEGLDLTKEIQRAASILDNAVGHRLHAHVANMLFDRMGRDAIEAAFLSPSLLSRADWRTKVYGAEGWDPQRSPTFVQWLPRLRH